LTPAQSVLNATFTDTVNGITYTNANYRMSLVLNFASSSITVPIQNGQAIFDAPFISATGSYTIQDLGGNILVSDSLVGTGFARAVWSADTQSGGVYYQLSPEPGTAGLCAASILLGGLLWRKRARRA